MIELKLFRTYPHLKPNILYRFNSLAILSDTVCLISGIFKFIMADNRPFWIWLSWFFQIISPPMAFQDLHRKRIVARNQSWLMGVGRPIMWVKFVKPERHINSAYICLCAKLKKSFRDLLWEQNVDRRTTARTAGHPARSPSVRFRFRSKSRKPMDGFFFILHTLIPIFGVYMWLLGFSNFTYIFGRLSAIISIDMPDFWPHFCLVRTLMHIYLQIMKDIFCYEFWVDMLFNKDFFERAQKFDPGNHPPPPPTLFSRYGSVNCYLL